MSEKKKMSLIVYFTYEKLAVVALILTQKKHKRSISPLQF